MVPRRQDPSGAAVAVDERVDGLELRMGDRGRDDGVHVWSGDPAEQVLEEPVEVGVRGWDVGRPHGSMVRPTDPVLDVTQGARPVRRLGGVRAVEQRVRLEDQRGVEASTVADFGAYMQGSSEEPCDLAGVALRGRARLGPRELALARVDQLDLRRRDRLAAQPARRSAPRRTRTAATRRPPSRPHGTSTRSCS